MAAWLTRPVVPCRDGSRSSSAIQNEKTCSSSARLTEAQERWVFVPVALGGAPWSVESYLTGEFEYLPATGPNLPPPVTGIWVTFTFGKHGVRWDGASRTS